MTITECIIEDEAVAQLAAAGVPLRSGSDLDDAGPAPERGLIGSLLRDAQCLPEYRGEAQALVLPSISR